MKKTVKVGTRESKLAVIQAELVINQLSKLNPQIDFQIVKMGSKGDSNLNIALDEFKEADIFTNQLDYALKKGHIDIAVHSFKDLPIYDDLALPIVALGQRENPFEALVLKDGLKDRTKAIGSSCKRRRLQFNIIYPDWQSKTIRGAVPDRIKQMEDGSYGGLILAVAGLKRLGLERLISKVFNLDEMIPSACQGIIALQGRAGEDYHSLNAFNSESSCISARAERTFVRELNSDGSSYNNGVYAELNGEMLTITGMHISPNGQIEKNLIVGPKENAEELGRTLAKLLIDRRSQCG